MKCKQEDLYFDLQYQHQNQKHWGMSLWTQCYSAVYEEYKWIPVDHWLAIFPEWLDSMFSKKYCLKHILLESNGSRNFISVSYLCMHLCTCIPEYTSAHIHRSTSTSCAHTHIAHIHTHRTTIFITLAHRAPFK